MPRETVSLVAVGDIMLGDQPACIGHGVRSKAEAKGIPFLFERVRDLMRSDVLFGNLETVLSDRGCDEKIIRSVEFRGRPAYAAGLAATGFKVMSVANNHAMQYEDQAFHESAEALRANGIFPLGIAERDGKSNCYAFARGEVRIKCFAYSYRPDNHRKEGVLYATENRLALDQIREAKAGGHAVVVSLHWGDEFLHVPSRHQIQLAHSMIDAGACLIIGHHPHVLQGIERYKNGYIAYSLGNFIADFWQVSVRKSGLLKCSIGKDGVENLEFVPLLINRDFQPSIPTADVAARMRAEMEEYNRAILSEAEGLGTGEQPEYIQAAEKAYRKYRMQSYLYFLRNLPRYRPSMVVQSFTRFTARRLAED